MKSTSGAMDTATMMKRARVRRIVVGAVALVVVVIGWYLFRPELLFVDKTVSEALPTAGPGTTRDEMSGSRTLASGSFHGVAHETKGAATIHALANGRRILRLTDFETSNGPDVRVYLVAANDATDNDTVKNAGHVELGKLKGNVGDQNYDVPEDVALDKYRAVTIWCSRFGVNFGTAPLSGTEVAMDEPQPVSLVAGSFHDGAHETKGTATIYRLKDGKRSLRLTDFATSNGPDVRVYLVAADDATDNDTVKNAGYVELGKLKGNVGDQNYDVPEDVELGKYRAVTIWCARFGVNFGTAPLAPLR